MRNIIWILIGLSALGFILAVLAPLSGNVLMGIASEGYSRACTNLALLAIALLLVSEKKGG